MEYQNGMLITAELETVARKLEIREHCSAKAFGIRHISA
jgi:hypothetical protein